MLNRILLIIVLMLWQTASFPQSHPTFHISGTLHTPEEFLTKEKLTLVLSPTARVIRPQASGDFLFDNIPSGEYTLEVFYQNQTIYTQQIAILGADINDLSISLVEAIRRLDPLPTGLATFSEMEGEDDNILQNIAPLLQSSNDVYMRILSFQWGNYFVRPRGLDIRTNKVLINGIEVNGATDGRPNWRMWGGLNDVFRYPDISLYAEPSNYHHGSLGGTSNFNTHASAIRKGTALTASLSNRNSYQYRLQATYGSGLNKNGWAFSASVSARLGGEPMFASAIEGGFWNAYSAFFAVEKQWKNQMLNLSLIGTYNQRGATSAPLTREVRNLFGNYYNPYWGLQAGKRRNERTREEWQPIVQLNYRWNINERSFLTATWSTHLAWEGNTTLARYNQSSASPIYYKYLPSYTQDQSSTTLPMIDYTGDNAPIKNAQINWDYLYKVNQVLSEQGEAAGYDLEQHREDGQDYALNVYYEYKKNSNARLYADLAYQYNGINQYAQIYDLLGASFVRDVDVFNNGVSRNMLKASNSKLGVGDRINYDALLHRHYAYLHAGGEVHFPKWDIWASVRWEYTAMQREGKMWNGLYTEAASLGKSQVLDFILPSVKGIITYKINGNHFVKMNVMAGLESPSLSEAFPNSRYENTSLERLPAKHTSALDINYIVRLPKIVGRATYYWINQSQQIDVNYYFLQTANGDNAFFTEVVNGIESLSQGVELSAEWNVTPTMVVSGAANYNQHLYNNHPNVTTLGQRLDGTFGTQNLGEAYMKNLRMPTGPQQAYNLGITYAHPRFWKFSLALNYVGSSFVSPAASRRTSLFAIDPSTQQTYGGYDETMARTLLQQEELEGGFYVNLFISKSWRIKTSTFGFQLSANNINNNLDIVTQGFEQSRYPSYPDLVAEKNRGDAPLFGNRYWFNQGISFFLNLFYRF